MELDRFAPYLRCKILRSELIKGALAEVITQQGR